MENPAPTGVMMSVPRFRFLPLLLLASAPAPAFWAAELDFNRDIRPILSENCFYCHGQDGNKRKAELRLDERPAALEKKAIVPGDPAASELVKRLFSADPEEVMPPPDSHRHLSPAQRLTLKQWIAQGAPYAPHWAFVAPVRPTPPEVHDKAWPRHPIDHFILAKLEASGLAPSPEADRSTLLRRLHLDLTGLPPSLEEQETFLADPSPQAYEQLVDRLLASPHFGERFALPWLDAARYADSNGFQQDGDTHQYLWRDWVVRALNADMPFDQFSIEQLAGDLLPQPSEDQLVATAFNRNHLLNGEGGAIAEEQRNVILFDRVDTTATTWMGLTVACAQCHDHKYDPITMRDYYSMMALFNNVPESGVPSGGGQYRIADPAIPVGNPTEKAKLQELEAASQQARAEAERRAASPETLAALAATEQELARETPVAWQVLAPTALSATDGVQLKVLEDQSIFAEGPRPDKANYTLTLPSSALPVRGFRIETIPDDRLPSKGAGRSDSGNAVLTKLKIMVGGQEIRAHAASANYSQGGFSPQGTIDDDPATAWAFHPDTAKPHELIVQTTDPIPAQLPVELTFEFQSDNKQHQLGRFRVAATASPQPATRQALADPLRAILAKAAPQRSPEEAAQLREYVSKNRAPAALTEARRLAAAAEKAHNDFRQGLPRVMVMSDAQPRQTKILDRGSYLTPREDVTGGTPGFLPALTADAPRNRLGFAQWLFRPDHPLTARVQVNRLWQYLFGIGLVKTAEDLGVQSEMPQHGPLLDWLAVEFRERGWSQKHLLRLLLNSSSYRQSSRVSPTLWQRDPENRLLARAARFRLPSLLLRDLALSSSGLLQTQLGGKPVYPYQPDSVWETLAITKERDFTYPASSGPDLYRRSLYTFWRRTIGPVNMFDASPRQSCKVRLAVTSTPLHALTTLNDLTWSESARVLAEQALLTSPDRSAQLAWATRRILSRPPTPSDLAALTLLFERQRAHYAADLPAAAAFIAVGGAPRHAALAPAEHAAMAATCLALLNLDEALTRQ